MKTGVIVIFVVFCFCKADLTDQSIDHPEGGPVPTIITHINTTNTDGHLLLSTINILDPKADSSLNNTISSQSSMPAPPNDLINRPLKGPIDKELNKGNNTFNTSTNDIKINILNSGLEIQGTAGSHSSEKAAVEKNKSEVPKDSVISENNAKLGHDLKLVGVNKSISPKTNEIVLENASTTKFSVETTTEPTTLVTTNIATDSTIPTITTDFTTPDNTYVTPSTYTETETTYSPYSTYEPTTIIPHSITLGVNISGSTDMPTFTNRLGSNTTTHDAVTTSTHHHRNGTHKSSTHRYHKHTPVSSTESTGHSYHRFNKYTNHHYGTKRTHTATTSSGHHRFKPTHKRTYIHNRFSDTTETTETSPNSTNISNNNVTTVTSTTSRYHRYKPVHKNQHSYHRYNKINTINDTALNNTNLEVNGTTAAPVTHTTHRYHRYKPVHKTHYSHRQYSHIKRKSHVNNDTKINSTNSEDNTETTTISAHRYHTYKPIHKTHHNYHSSHHIRTTENILNGSTTEASNNGDNNTETTTMSVISSSTHRYHRFHPKTNIYNSKNIQRSHNKPSGSYFYTTRHHSHIEQGNDGDYTTTEMPINKNIYQKYRYRNHFSNNFLNRPSSTDNPNSTSSNTITPNTTTSSLPLEKTDNPNSTISETSTSVYERFRHNRPNFLNSRFGTVNNHIEIHHSNISSEQNAINSNGTKTEEPNINPEEDSGTDTTTEISSTYAYDRYKRMRHRMSFKPHFTVSKHVHPSESNTSESMGNETTTIRPISRTNIYQRYRNVHRPMQMKPLVQVNHKETTVTDDEATVSEHTTQPGITAEITSVYDRYRTFRHRMNFKPHVETSKGTTQTHSNTSEPSPTESIGNEITTQEPTESTSVYERFRHAHRPRLMRPLVQVRHQETTTLDSTQTLSNSSEPNSTDSFGNEITTQEPTVSTSVYERFRHLRRPMHIRPLMQARHEETTTIDTTDTTEIHLNPSEYIQTDRYGNEITTQEPTARTSVYERFRQAHRPMRMRPLMQARHEETTTLDTTDTTQIHLNPSESIPTDRYGNEITTQEPTASSSVYERFRHAHRPMRMRPLVQARHEEITTLDTTDTTQIHLNPSESIPTDRYGNEITTQEPTASTSVYERFRHASRPVHMRPLMQVRHKETTTSDITDTTDSTTEVTITTDTTDVTSLYDRYRKFRNIHRPVHMKPIITTVVPNTSETTYDLQDNESSAITDATTNIAETNRPRIHMRPRISQVNHNEFSAHSQHPKRMRYNRHLYDRRPLSQHKTIIKDDINENAETILAPELSGNEHTDNRQRHLNQRSFSENEDDDSVNSVPTREVMVDHDTNYHQPIHMRPRYLAIHRRPSDANENYDESDLDPEESGYKVRRRVHNRHLRRRSQHYYTESDPPEYYGAYGKNIPEGRNNDGIPPKFQNQISQNLATKTDSIGVMYEEDPVGHDHEGHVKVKHSISDSEYFNSLESDDSFQVNPLHADASASESIINREDRDTFGTNTSNIVLNNEENNASNTKIRQNGSLSENTSEHKGDDRVSFGLGDTLFADEASDDLLFEAEDHVGSDLFGDAVEPTISPFEKVTVSLPKSFYSSSLDDVSEEANNQTSLKKTNNTINEAPKNSEDNEELMKESNISGISETELHQMQKYIDERKSITDEETTEQQLVTVDPKHWYTLSYHQDTSDSNEVDSESTPKSETIPKSETTPKPIIITEELVSSVTSETQNFTTENILTKEKIESVTVTETTATTEAGTTENKVIYFTMPYEDNNNSSEMNTKSKTIEKGYSLEELGVENIGIKSIIDVSTEPSTISTTDNVQIGTSGLFLFTDNKTEQTELPLHKNKTTKGENITVEELNITNIEPVNSNNKSEENLSNINESRTEMTVQLTTELNIFNSKNNTENNKNETTVIDNAKDTNNYDNNKIELISNNKIKNFTEEPATNGVETVKILERMDTEDKVKESDILVKQKQNDSSSNSSIENMKTKKDSISTNSLKEISTEANLDAETTTESERNSTTVSLTESNILSLATTNQTVVQEGHPFIVTNIFGHKSNFTAQLQIQNSSDYLPSDVNVTEDAINQVLNFTWSPYEAVVNTISLNLRKVSKHYVIDGLQLYLVKDGNVSLWTKNEIQPQKDEVSKQLCLEIEKGIRVMFSNLDFLTAEEEESILADKHQVEAAEKSDMKIMSIEIIGGVGVLLCAVFVAMIVSYRIIKMKKRGKATLNSRV